MLDHDPVAPRLGRIDAPDVPAFVDAMAPREMRVLAGLDASTLADLLAAAPPPRRPILRLDLAGPGGAAARIAGAIDQLARAVSGLWPYLWGGEDFSQLRDDALSRAHLPLRLDALAARHPGLSRAWAQETVPRLLQSRAPRLAAASSPLEWRQLALAFAPTGLVVAVPLAPEAEIFVAAAEWLALHADVAVLVLAETMPGPAYERILYGAREIAPAPVPLDELPEPPTTRLLTAVPPLVIALPETEGMPHPQSEVELKLYTLIRADAELRPLFAFNRFVPNLPLQAKADVLWTAGRLVVEIDGPEHRGTAKYRSDRRRDATLTLAGWRVLRFTNEDIIADAALPLALIREAVALAQREGR